METPSASSTAFLAGPRVTSLVAPPVEDWEPPEESLCGAASRGRDFVRFAELQTRLKKGCAQLLHFVRRDFDALARALPEHADECRRLGRLEGGKLTESVAKFTKSLQALAQRMEDRERLRIVFIGPVNAGKTTLVNMLLTAQLGDFESLLPTSPQAETNRIWKVSSCNGSRATVVLNGRELHCESPAVEDAAAMADARNKVAKFLEENLCRDAQPEDQGEINISLPLAMLDPFGCHYCLVDTPGYTESDEYKNLVAKYLHDHSHIACMVCNLNQGKAIVQSTRDMMSKSHSRTFWVLTQYDDLMTKGKKGQDPRQVAEKAVQDFRSEVQQIDPNAKVFKHGAKVLMPQDFHILFNVLQQYLPKEEAAGWLDAIRLHVKDCFLEIQHRNHVLDSQSRHCMDAASDLVTVYTSLKDGSTGTLAANEYYVRELQTKAEEAADQLEREISEEVEAVKTVQLDLLCQQAADQLKTHGRWTFLSQESYYAALSRELAPLIHREIQERLDAAVQRAHRSVLETAQRLLQEAGVDRERGAASQSGHGMLAPDASHLRSRYPLESVVTLSAAACSAGAIALTETGAALLAGLGMRLGAASVAGLVGVAVVSFATLGYTMKKAAEVNPCWTYAATEADVVAKVRQQNQWSILAEAVSGRARAHLLSSVSQFRYSFSIMLLHNGAPRNVLESLFPDLPLFEKVHQNIQSTCRDVQEFTNAPDLMQVAGGHLEQCRSSAHMAEWGAIIELTGPYVEPNARTDAVSGMVLSSLFHIRCHALLRSSMFGDACASAEVFRQTFPQLVLPVLYRTAAHLRFEYLRGGLESEAALAEVSRCQERLEGQHASREVPRELEIWFHAVAASWLEAGDSMARLLRSVRCFMVDQMKTRPSRQRIAERVAVSIRARAAAVNKELSADLLQFLCSLSRGGGHEGGPADGEQLEALQEVERAYREECSTYANGVVNSVHLLLGTLLPDHIDMTTLAGSLVETMLSQISQQLRMDPAMEPDVEIQIRSLLCPADEGNVLDLCSEWVRVLGQQLRSSPVGSL